MITVTRKDPDDPQRIYTFEFSNSQHDRSDNAQRVQVLDGDRLIGETWIRADDRSRWLEAMAAKGKEILSDERARELLRRVTDGRRVVVDGEMVVFAVRSSRQMMAAPADFNPLGLSPDTPGLTARGRTMHALLLDPTPRSHIAEYSDEELRALWRVKRES